MVQLLEMEVLILSDFPGQTFWQSKSPGGCCVQTALGGPGMAARAKVQYRHADSFMPAKCYFGSIG